MTDMNRYFYDYIALVAERLGDMQVTLRDGTSIENDSAIQHWAERTHEVDVKKNGTFFFVGNGASATMSEHMAADALKNAHLKTITCSESAYLTAVGNDYSVEEMFSVKIDRMFTAADMLIATSSSGNSPNIIRAVETAGSKGGLVVTLSGMKSDNRIRQLGDLNFFVPATTYGTVEVCHAALMHCWLDVYLDLFAGGRL